MKTTSTTIAASALALACLMGGTEAKAGGPAMTNWTGCYVGIEGGAAFARNNATITQIDNDGPGNVQTSTMGLNGLGADGGTYGLNGGCDYQMNHFVLGVWADYDWFTGLNTNISGSGVGNIAAFSSEKNQWAVGGRLGYLITQSTLAYGLAGYTQMDTGSTNLVGLPLVAFPAFSGYTVGGGLQTDIGNNFKLGLEYRFNKYRSETQQVFFDGVDDTTNLTLQPDVQTVKATLTYTFNFTPAPVSYPPPMK